jgi:hypothetical protein
MKRREKLKDVIEFVQRYNEIRKIKAYGQDLAILQRGQELLKELNEWLNEEVEE